MDHQKPFIIVLDDDDEDRYLLHYCFSELGLDENVKFFSDSIQFIRYTELIGSLNVKPSLVILDHKVPYMSGKALINYLKSNSPFGDIPVVVLSANLPPETQEKLFGLGVTACHLKGPESASLLPELKEIMKYAAPVEKR